MWVHVNGRVVLVGCLLGMICSACVQSVSCPGHWKGAGHASSAKLQGIWLEMEDLMPPRLGMMLVEADYWQSHKALLCRMCICLWMRLGVFGSTVYVESWLGQACSRSLHHSLQCADLPSSLGAVKLQQLCGFSSTLDNSITPLC